MGSVHSTIWSVILCFLVGLSVAHPVTDAKAIRFMSSPHSSKALEKLFAGVRQGGQGVTSTSKSMPLCSSRAFDQAVNIDDTCLSCATNTGTGQVSNCPEGCCRGIAFTEDLEAAHFITCLNGCCVRSIGILSPTSDREAGILNYEGVFIIKNDVTLNEISSFGQCVTEDGFNDKCGSTCAVFTPTITACSTATSFRVPAVGENFVEPPCDGVDDLPEELAQPGEPDDSPDETADPEDDGDGDKEGDDFDGNATGPADGEGDIDVDASPTEDDMDDSEPEPSDDNAESAPVDGEETGEEVINNSEGDGTDDPVCFPATATVRLENGKKKRMDELKTGDMVLVGARKYSKVFGFTHRTHRYKGRFVEVRTSSGQVLRLTHGHYMYSDGVARRAQDVRVGERVELFDGGVAKIVEVGEWIGVGLFNPQTWFGDIVVDDVVVSTYTDAVDARMAHALLTPVRAVSTWFDVSSMLSRMADILRRGRRLVTTSPSKLFLP